MSPNHTHPSSEEAEEILEATLTEGDLVEVQTMYKDLSRQIRWKQALDAAFPLLVELGEELMDSDEMHKAKHDPLAGDGRSSLLNPNDPKTMARKHLTVLSLTKKLLGGLKTRVNRGIEDIRILSYAEELDLLTVACEPEPAVADEEESEDADESKAGELPANIQIGPERGCIRGGSHTRTTTSWRKLNGGQVREVYCKDCRTTIETAYNTGKLRSKRLCTHPDAEWVDGKEGKEAICINPFCRALVPNPGTYNWVVAGLEPYGDDPTKDKAEVLCSNY